MVFGQSAALTGAGALAGSTTIAFGNSAALTGDGALVGSGALLFGNNATLSAGDISGSTSLVFTATGALTGEAALSGVASLIFGQSATLTSLTPADVVATSGGAGKPTRTRKRKVLVSVDGEEFSVSSVAEAEEILAQVRQQAEEQAELVTERAIAATNRPQRKILADARKSLVVPSIKVPVDLQPQVDALRAEIESIYNAAIQAVEIGALMRKQAEQEDEDDLLMLLL